MKTELFQRLVAILEEEGIHYALLGNTESYPEVIGSDVDIMVSTEHINQFQKIIWTIEDDKTRVVQMLQHEPVAFYYVVVYTGEYSFTVIQPDVCTDYYRNGKHLLSAQEMLEDKRLALDLDGNSKGFYVLAPEKEFIYYLLKKIDKDELSVEQFDHLRKCFDKNPNGAMTLSSSFWSEKSVLLIHQALECDGYNALHSLLPTLRRELHRRLRISIHDKFKRIFQRLNRCLYPTGFVVKLKGEVDSMYKLGEEISELLGSAFRRKVLIDLSALSISKRFFLPLVILKGRIRSTLIILVGKRNLNLVPANAVVDEDEKGICLSTRSKTEYISSLFKNKTVSYVASERLVNLLSKRTRKRCRMLAGENYKDVFHDT